MVRVPCHVWDPGSAWSKHEQGKNINKVVAREHKLEWEIDILSLNGVAVVAFLI